MKTKPVQNQPMKGRPATQIEVEAFGSICKMQDELHEARKIIRSLLRASSPYMRAKYPVLYTAVNEFLEK